MTDLSLFRHPQKLFLHSALIAILTDVPYLELSLSDMRFQLQHIFWLRELYVEYLRQDLSDFVLLHDLPFEFAVVLGEVLLEALHCLVLFQLAQHAHERSKHLDYIHSINHHTNYSNFIDRYTRAYLKHGFIWE
jgi:hypothetical protein